MTEQNDESGKTLEEKVDEDTPVKVLVTEEQKRRESRKQKMNELENKMNYILGLMSESAKYMLDVHIMPVYKELVNDVKREGFEGEFGEKLEYLDKGLEAVDYIFSEITNKDIYKNGTYKNRTTSEKDTESKEEIGNDNLVLAIELRDMKKPYEGLFGLEDHIKEFEETLDSGNGVILCGAAGCGKTELIRGYIKKHLDDTFFVRLKPKSVLKKYIGESEEKLDDIFEYIGKNDGIIIIDEGDWMLSRRDSESNSRWDNKLISAVLGEMDGLDKSHKARLIVTTNRLELLDPAFLRAGRFGEIIDIPMPDEEVRYKIIEHNFNKMLEKGAIEGYSLNLNLLAKATEGVCPADIVNGLFESLPKYCKKNNIKALGEKELYGFFESTKDIRMQGLYDFIKNADKGQKGKCLARDIGYA